MDIHADHETTAETTTETSNACARELRAALGLVSPAELAALLCVDVRTLTTWRVRGQGPDFVRLGRGVFYRRTAIEAWIELNERPTNRTA
jgi:hypothetical protein